MPTIYDCALLAQDVYNDAAKSINGHFPVYVPGGEAMMSDHFFGAAYKGPADVGVIAFRGSQEIEDWAYADADIAAGAIMKTIGMEGRLPVDQMGNAFGFFGSAKKILAKAGCRRFVVTGHSLGGGLASVVGARIRTSHVRAVTFNAPGMANCSKMVAPEDDASLLSAVRAVFDEDLSLSVRAGAAIAANLEFGKKVVNKLGEVVYTDATASVKISTDNWQNVWNVRTFHDPVSRYSGAAIGRDYIIPGTNKQGLSVIEKGMEHTMSKLLPPLKASYLGSHQV